MQKHADIILLNNSNFPSLLCNALLCYQTDCYKKNTCLDQLHNKTCLLCSRDRVRLLALPILRIIVIRIRNQEAREKGLVICRVIASRDWNQLKSFTFDSHCIMCNFYLKKGIIWLIQFYPVCSFVCCLWQVNKSALQAIIIVTWYYWIWYVKYHVSIAYIVH